jgi:hypothetical protein
MHKSLAPSDHGDYINTVAPNIFESSVWNLLHVTLFLGGSGFLKNLYTPYLMVRKQITDEL